jgi:hypothetical protein
MGLEWLHSLDPPIFHGDLSLSNLMVDDDGHIRVSGICFPFELQQEWRLETAREKLMFLAPECLKGKYDAKSDVYSFGFLLWELYMRRPLFPNLPTTQALLKQLMDDHQRPDIPNECPPLLCSLISDCWDSNPDHRVPPPLPSLSLSLLLTGPSHNLSFFFLQPSFTELIGRLKAMLVELESPLFERAKGKKIEAPSISWKRKLSDVFPPHQEFSVGVKEGAKMAPLGFRMWRYVHKERKEGRVPIMDPFNHPAPGPLMGVPLGGIGAGSIGRGWRGDMNRWHIHPASIPQFCTPDASQFSIRVHRGNSTHATVLNPRRPTSAGAKGWEWNLTGTGSTYYGLFPRAWTEYREEVDPDLVVTSMQISPVIPHNYRHTSYPSAAFIWSLNNKYNHLSLPYYHILSLPSLSLFLIRLEQGHNCV